MRAEDPRVGQCDEHNCPERDLCKCGRCTRPLHLAHEEEEDEELGERRIRGVCSQLLLAVCNLTIDCLAPEVVERNAAPAIKASHEAALVAHDNTA